MTCACRDVKLIIYKNEQKKKKNNSFSSLCNCCGQLFVCVPKCEYIAKQKEEVMAKLSYFCTTDSLNKSLQHFFLMFSLLFGSVNCSTRMI